jgi:hypothetical protein
MRQHVPALRQDMHTNSMAAAEGTPYLVSMSIVLGVEVCGRRLVRDMHHKCPRVHHKWHTQACGQLKLALMGMEGASQRTSQQGMSIVSLA